MSPPPNRKDSRTNMHPRVQQKNMSEPTDLKGMTFMTTPADRELNKRLIEISKALSTLVCGASTADDVVYIRDEALRSVAEQSEIARLRLSRSASGTR